MHQDFENLCDSLGMTEIIRLQTMLSTALVRRFERRMAVSFSDVVGSTPYFAKFGDEAGRKLQQRHLDLLVKAIASAGGRIVDTAGDGAFLCFQTVDEAIASVVELQNLISIENLTRTREHQLAARIGVHHGSVLTDGIQVTGDAVNYCSRVAATASPGEIRLTKEAFFALADARQRLKCRMLPPVSVKGIERPAELMMYQWRDQSIFPTKVRLETGREYTLPDQDIISLEGSGRKTVIWPTTSCFSAPMTSRRFRSAAGISSCVAGPAALSSGPSRTRRPSSTITSCPRGRSIHLLRETPCASATCSRCDSRRPFPRPGRITDSKRSFLWIRPPSWMRSRESLPRHRRINHTFSNPNHRLHEVLPLRAGGITSISKSISGMGSGAQPAASARNG